MKSQQPTKRRSKKFLVRIGAGRRVTIPKEIMAELKLKMGDYLMATLDKRRRCMILTPIKQPVPKKRNLYQRP
jgi:bifunctional DNA-binding transcriptional regulator/antitoxin component of YhaV-PrlF toxin-antitoxin module